MSHTDLAEKDRNTIDDGTITREKFDGMTHQQRYEFFAAGGKVVNQEPEKIDRPDLPEGQMYRSDFDALGPSERMEFATSGGTIVP